MGDELRSPAVPSEIQVEPVCFRAMKPSPRLIWVVLLFFLSFLVTALGLTWIVPDGALTIWALIFSIVISLVTWLVPFSNYCLELKVFPDQLQITKKDGITISLSLEKINLIAVGSRLNLNDGSLESWGCLYLLAEKRRYGFLLPSGTIIDAYRILTTRMPSALGIGGDGKIDLPMISDLSAIQLYVLKQRQSLARELTRETLRNVGRSCFAILIVGVSAFVLLGKSNALPALFQHGYPLDAFLAFLMAILFALCGHALKNILRRAEILKTFDGAIKGGNIDESVVRHNSETYLKQ